MAAKKNDPRREARIAKNNRNLNSALTLFTAGFIAEFYLLLINQYFVKGSVDQVVAIAGYLEVMAIVGAAAFGAGVVLTVMRRKWTRFAAAGKWLLGLGLFFGVSSLLMRRVYPMGTTVMCILVPVLMLLAVVFLLCSAQSRQLLHARSGDRLLLGRYGARCRSARADRDAAEA